MTTAPSVERINISSPVIVFVFVLVRLEGLEPPRRKALEPKSSVSTNFTTGALSSYTANITPITVAKF